MRRGRGFYEGRSSSKAITCPWCLFNVDLIKSADDIKLGEQLTCLKAGLLFRGLQTGTSWNPARTNTSSCPGKEECWQICGVGPDRFGSNSAEKGLWVLVGSNINMCQSCTLASTQWTASWAALIACRLREVIILLYLALTSPHPEYSIPFSGWDENFAWREDTDELKQVLCLWKLEHMHSKDVLREVWACSAWKQRFGGTFWYIRDCYPRDRDRPFTVMPDGQMGLEKKVPGKV